MSKIPKPLPSDAGEPTGRVQAIDRAFIILRELAKHPNGQSALELARNTGIDRTTTHRLLKTLMHWGMAAGESGVYFVGAECALLATGHLNRAKVRRIALPFAVELQEKVLRNYAAVLSISIPARDEVVIIERLWTPATPINVITDIGDHFPIDLSASGKSILSTFSREECIERIGKERYAAIESLLVRSRKQDGFSAGHDDFKPGLSSLAYPIIGPDGTACAAMVIAGLDLTAHTKVNSDLAQHLRRVCQNVSASLGNISSSSRAVSRH
ncbi:IclR family transcriptional regulator [Burkholderia stagnalis]|uniref:IclR family transcriptional regulator n=1 Tax=Burkholderia stagnalis TaxID=1503054 RepID=UPI0016399A37|nr:IclR family transcriptional regulator [Burkholderia stagnalis]